MSGQDSRPLVGGDESFVLTLGGAGGAAVMASALGRKLAEVATRGKRYIVIVALEDPGWHYTQCLLDPDDGAWIEAVSNKVIEPAELRFGPHEESILADLGFEPPDDDSPNHNRRIEHPVPWSVVADLLTIPLVAVYGADRHDRVRVEVFPGIEHEAIPGPPTDEPRAHFLIPGQLELPFSERAHLEGLGLPDDRYFEAIQDPALRGMSDEEIGDYLGSPDDYKWTPITVNGVDFQSDGKGGWTRA